MVTQPRTRPSSNKGFIEQISRNLTFWATAVTEDERFQYRLHLEKENIIKAIRIGLSFPETTNQAIDLIILLTGVMGRVGDSKTWLDQLERGIEVCPPAEKAKRMALELRKAWLFCHSGNLADAEPLIDAINHQVEKEQRTSWESIALNCYFNLRRGALDAAASLARQSEVEPKATPHQKGISQYLMGLICVGKAEYAQAISHLQNARARVQTSTDHYDRILILENIGKCQLFLGQIETACQTLEKATELQAMIPDQFYAVGVPLRLGEAYLALEKLEAAEKTIRQINYEHLRNNGEEYHLADASSILAEILSAKREWAEAEMLFDNALQIWEQIGDERARARTFEKRNQMVAKRNSIEKK